VVRLVLGEKRPEDNATSNVYTRAAADLDEWIRRGALAQDRAPCFFAYSQEFNDPDTGRRTIRKGFVGLGELSGYSERIVHRHEQTLTGPKRDRLELLRHTRAQFEQLFLLYADEEHEIDNILDDAAKALPLAEITDEYGAVHRLWRIATPRTVSVISGGMRDRKLIIADGHHRYETAIAFRDENPELPGARLAPMTLVNIHSPGLRILATHRVAGGLDVSRLGVLQSSFPLAPLDSKEDLKARFAVKEPGKIRIGVAHGGRIEMLEAERGDGDLDVNFLHQRVLQGVFGVGEEAVREEKHISYVRGIDAAMAMAGESPGMIGFLMEPTTIDQVVRVSLSGGVMPQKSTDFYPKLLSGLAMYRM
ncbi:MAG: DUF1015 family protein, partial [Bryobacteraceae bacterium]